MAAFSLSNDDYNSALVLGNGPTAGGRSYKGYSNNITVLNDGLVAANAGGAGMSFSFSHWVPIYDPTIDPEITNYCNNPWGYSYALDTYLKSNLISNNANNFIADTAYRFLIGYTGTRLRHSSGENIITNIKQGNRRLLEFVVDHDTSSPDAETYNFYSMIHDEVLFKLPPTSKYQLLDSDKTKSKFIKYEGITTVASTNRGFESYSSTQEVDAIGFVAPTAIINSISNNLNQDFTLSRWLIASTTEDTEASIKLNIASNNRHYFTATGETSSLLNFQQVLQDTDYITKFNTAFPSSVSSISSLAIPLNVANQYLYTGVHFTPQSLTSEGRVRGVYEIEDGSLGQASIKFNKVLLFITVGTEVVPFAVISIPKPIIRDVTGKHGLQRVNISFVLDFKTDSQSGNFAPVQYGTGGWVQLKTATLSETSNLNEVDTVLATQKGAWVYSFENKISNISNTSQNAQNYISKYILKYGISEASNQTTAGVLSGKVSDGERPLNFEAVVNDSVTPNDNTITNRSSFTSGILTDFSNRGTYLVNTYSDYNSTFAKTWSFLTSQTTLTKVLDSDLTFGGFTYGLAFSKVDGQRGAIGKNTVLYGTGSQITPENTLLIGDYINVLQYDSDSVGDDRSTRNSSLLSLHTAMDTVSNPNSNFLSNVRAWKSIISAGIKPNGNDTSKTSTFAGTVAVIESSSNGLIRNSFVNLKSYERNTNYTYAQWDLEDISYSSVIGNGVLNSRVASSTVNAGLSNIVLSTIIGSTVSANAANNEGTSILNSSIQNSTVWSNSVIQDSYISGVNLTLYTDGQNISSFGRFRYNGNNSGEVNTLNPVSKQIADSAGNNVSLFNSNLGTIDGGNNDQTPYMYSSNVNLFKTNIAFRRLFVASDVMLSSLQRLPNGDVFDYSDTYQAARTILIDNILNSRLMGSFKTQGGRLSAFSSDIHIANNGIIFGTYVNSKIFGVQDNFAFFGATDTYESDVSIGRNAINGNTFVYGSSNSGYANYIQINDPTNSVINNKHIVDAYDGVYSIARREVGDNYRTIIDDYKDVSGEYISSGKRIYYHDIPTGTLSQQLLLTTKKDYNGELVYIPKTIAGFVAEAKSRISGEKTIAYKGPSSNSDIRNNINLGSLNASDFYIKYDTDYDYTFVYGGSNNTDRRVVADSGKVQGYFRKSNVRSDYESSFNYSISSNFETFRVSGKGNWILPQGSTQADPKILSEFDTLSFLGESDLYVSGTSNRKLSSSKKFGTRISQRVKQLTSDGILAQNDSNIGEFTQLTNASLNANSNSALTQGDYNFSNTVLSPIGIGYKANGNIRYHYSYNVPAEALNYVDFPTQNVITFLPLDNFYGYLNTDSSVDFSGYLKYYNKNAGAFAGQIGAAFDSNSATDIQITQVTQNGKSDVSFSVKPGSTFAPVTKHYYSDSIIKVYDIDNDLFSGNYAKRFNTVSISGDKATHFADSYYDGKINKYTLYTTEQLSSDSSATNGTITSMAETRHYYTIFNGNDLNNYGSGFTPIYADSYGGSSNYASLNTYALVELNTFTFTTQAANLNIFRVERDTKDIKLRAEIKTRKINNPLIIPFNDVLGIPKQETAFYYTADNTTFRSYYPGYAANGSEPIRTIAGLNYSMNHNNLPYLSGTVIDFTTDYAMDGIGNNDDMDNAGIFNDHFGDSRLDTSTTLVSDGFYTKYAAIAQRLSVKEIAADVINVNTLNWANSGAVSTFNNVNLVTTGIETNNNVSASPNTSDLSLDGIKFKITLQGINFEVWPVLNDIAYNQPIFTLLDNDGSTTGSAVNSTSTVLGNTYQTSSISLRWNFKRIIN